MEPSSRVCSRESWVESDNSLGRAVRSFPGSWEVERRWYCSSTPLALASLWGEPSACWRDSWEECVASLSSAPLLESAPSMAQSRLRKSWDKMLEVATKNSTGPLWALSDVIPFPDEKEEALVFGNTKKAKMQCFVCFNCGSPVILGMPSSLGTGKVTIMPWAVPTHSSPWQISRLVTHTVFWPMKKIW